MYERHTNIAMRLQKAALEALEKLDASELSFKDIREAVNSALSLSAGRELAALESTVLM